MKTKRLIARYLMQTKLAKTSKCICAFLLFFITSNWGLNDIKSQHINLLAFDPIYFNRGITGACYNQCNTVQEHAICVHTGAYFTPKGHNHSSTL